MTKTKIEWANEVWNPTTGCSKVSEGCRHCYAERIANRFWGERKFTDIQLHPERLEDPLKWRKPRRVFVDSMSDLFHENVPKNFIVRVFNVMIKTRQHTYMILTKRPARMLEFLNDQAMYCGKPHPTWNAGNNIWLGVSVEDQKTADERIPLLLQTPAAVRFVSYEPALGPIDFRPYLYGWHSDPRPVEEDPGIDWIIMGGESGPDARPMHPDWARSVRDQCQAAGAKFFFKQWGEWMPITSRYSIGDDESNLDELDGSGHTICFGNRGTLYQEDRAWKEVYWCGYQPDPWQNPWFLERVGKKAAGRMLDGRTWDEYPTITTV